MKQLGLDGPEEKEAEPLVEFAGNVGDKVRIISGAWSGYDAVIREINNGRQTLQVGVEVFGRETPLTIGFKDVEMNEK